MVVVAAIFERRRHFNVPVQWARHPDLREYIHSAVASLEPWIQQVRLLSLTRGMDLCFGGSPPADGWSGGHGCRAPWRRSRCCLWTATKSQWRRSCSSYASSNCPQDTSSSLSAASSSSSASVLRSYRLCHQVGLIRKEERDSSPVIKLTLHLHSVADCSWELVAYTKSLSAADKGQFWIPANDSGGWSQSSTITTIKSMRSSCLDMQLYVEHPVTVPQ